eukprot:3179925-Amphidinium_carterae.1
MYNILAELRTGNGTMPDILSMASLTGQDWDGLRVVRVQHVLVCRPCQAQKKTVQSSSPC